MSVVKADAYGHGAKEISRVASETGVDYLGVAFLEEADEIRGSGIEMPIAILYPEAFERAIEAVKRGYIISVSSHDDVRRIRESIHGDNHPMRYFIKTNTGMNRYGMDVEAELIESTVRATMGDDGFMGFTTNLADPFNSRRDLADRQLDRFFEIMKSATRFSRNGILFSYEASGSLWENRAAEGSLVRVGLLMYGISPNGGSRSDFRPVMSVKSKIAEIHRLQQGEGVGYGFSYIAARDSRVAVIPMGYADGYPWALSNKGSVLIRGKMAPVAGRICMDAFTVDVTDVEGASPGDDVVVMGSQGDHAIDAVRLGELAGSFAYEIVSGWGKRMPRIYI